MPELFRAENLSHVFSDGRKGLDSLSLSISDGECILVAGRNGAGKSLLMRHFVGLSRPTSGTVYFRGLPLHTAIPRVRREVGYVFQDTESQIFGQTVAEDVAFGPANLGMRGKELDALVERALEEANLAGFASRRPHTLSGGERRRLALAGVLAMSPSCIILDEPFANLDLPSVRDVIEVLTRLRSEGKTIIVLTHEIEKMFRLASRLIVLEAGNLVFDDAPFSASPDLFDRCGLACPYEDHFPWLVRG